MTDLISMGKAEQQEIIEAAKKRDFKTFVSVESNYAEFNLRFYEIIKSEPKEYVTSKQLEADQSLYQTIKEKIKTIPRRKAVEKDLIGFIISGENKYNEGQSNMSALFFGERSMERYHEGWQDHKELLEFIKDYITAIPKIKIDAVVHGKKTKLTKEGILELANDYYITNGHKIDRFIEGTKLDREFEGGNITQTEPNQAAVITDKLLNRFS